MFLPIHLDLGMLSQQSDRTWALTLSTGPYPRPTLVLTRSDPHPPYPIRPSEFDNYVVQM